MPQVAEIVARTLKAYDTEYFFQVTGGDQALWLALERAGIRMIPCRSEQAAAYMADGYARVSGKPGFVYGQHGPGAVNVAAGLADAFWAMSPVVSLTSSIPHGLRQRYAYQDVDQLAVVAPLTLWAQEATQGSHVAHMLRTAIRVATGSPPGPVHLQIPRDLIPAETPDVTVYREATFDARPVRSAPTDQDVRGIVAALTAAERPVLVAGNGVLVSGAWEQIEVLAELLQIPVATTLGGKGAIREDHDLAVGVIGRYAGVAANDIVRQSDVALVVGSRLGGLATDGYTVPSPSARLIHIDVSGRALGATYRESLSVQADAKLTLQAVIERVSAMGATGPHEWARAAQERRAAWAADVDRLEASRENVLHPARVIGSLRAALATDDILVADTGYMTAWAGVLYRVLTPGRNFLRAAGSLGWAFPAALGAALAAPDRRVVAVIGDGGIGYNLAEVETAVRLEIPVLVVVMNNRTLAFEYHLQKYFEDHAIPEANDFTDADYAAAARGLGARGQRISSAADLDEAVARFVADPEPTLLDVSVDKETIAPVTLYESVMQRVV